jgi:CelD/BcsL family acetyltransferase involved in cellulose biosynthesis
MAAPADTAALTQMRLDAVGGDTGAAVAHEEGIAEWSELADRTQAPPFLHPGWMAAWAGAFGGARVSVLTLRREGRLVAAVPFTRTAGATVAPTNWHTPQFGLLAEDVAARRDLARLLVERTRHRLDVAFLPSGSDDVRELEAVSRAAGHRTQVRTMQRSPYVQTDGNWEAYQARLGSRRLRELRRRHRRLESEGSVAVEFARPTSGDRLEGLLSEGFAVEGSGWKTEQGTAILSRPETLRFYSDVARWAASRGWLVLAFLRVDGRPAAFDLCLEAYGRICVLKGGFDPAFRAFAPRTILLRASLERAFAEPLRSYEFLGADEPYKLPWSTGVREFQRVQAFPPSPTGTAGYLAWRFGRPAAKRALALRARRA